MGQLISREGAWWAQVRGGEAEAKSLLRPNLCSSCDGDSERGSMQGKYSDNVAVKSHP